VLGDAETIENVIETLRKHFGPRAP
jgi:hypothetical protein